jgi:glucose-1-phosphatase
MTTQTNATPTSSSMALDMSHSPAGCGPSVLLFDLGGVLIDIDFSRALRAWQAMSELPFDELQQAFVFDAAYEAHERGELAAADYFSHLASTLRLRGSPQQVAAGWNAIFMGEITATTTLVQAASTRLPCFAFTNTNATHQACWSQLYPQVVASFDGIFSSHQMGLRKPEPLAFAHICQVLQRPPASILFFDDLLLNVEGARAAGLQAVWVRSPQDVQQGLQGIGAIDSTFDQHRPTSRAAAPPRAAG